MTYLTIHQETLIESAGDDAFARADLLIRTRRRKVRELIDELQAAGARWTSYALNQNDHSPSRARSFLECVIEEALDDYLGPFLMPDDAAERAEQDELEAILAGE